jgi:hypothetical protein
VSPILSSAVRRLALGCFVVVFYAALDAHSQALDPPPSCNEGASKARIAAFGNSDDDLQMLQYTAAGDGARLMLIVHHDDAVREYAYDRKSSIGRLDKALDAANAQGWTVVSMKNGWRKVFPFA